MPFQNQKYHNMKNPKGIVILMLMMLCCKSVVWAQKIAYVEPEAIIPEMPTYKKAQSEIEAYGKQLQNVLEKKKMDMEAYYQAVLDSIKRDLLSPKAQKEAEAKLQQMQIDFQQENVAAEKKMLQKEKELIAPVYEVFNKAIAKVAYQNEYNYILDKKFLLYATGGIDATQKVKTALGISW